MASKTGSQKVPKGPYKGDIYQDGIVGKNLEEFESEIEIAIFGSKILRNHFGIEILS